jgi:ADP-ribosylglycohydrolase
MTATARLSSIRPQARQAHDERTYAGVLGKIIGVYYGRPVEGWRYPQIRERLGVVDHYVAEELGAPLIIPDDDISGTFVYARAAADHADILTSGPAAVGQTWLNYTVEGKTVLWWGGLCRSTEHTAFLRLKQGISAPESGSIALNGRSMAEGVGAQIFIDGWGLMSPGDPERAARLARNAALVSHDGLAVSASMFLAAMEALAFIDQDIDSLIDTCLPLAGDGRLCGLVDGVRAACASATDWREARDWIEEHHGYRRYPGSSPMATNHAAVLMSLLMAGDEFHRSLLICTSAGWDTDSNAGNVGCLNGIRLGLDGINAGADLRGPIADRLYAVSSDGGDCVTDAVRETRRILCGRARLNAAPERAPTSRFRFEYRNSVQGFAAHGSGPRQALTTISNADGQGLTLSYRHLAAGAVAAVSTPTSGPPEPTGIRGTSYFEVVGSPTLYPSQTVKARIRADAQPPGLSFFIETYGDDGQLSTIRGSEQQLASAINTLEWVVPETGGRVIHRLGIELRSQQRRDGSIVIESIDWSGAPENYMLGPSSDLSPGLTPWTTDTAWLRTFVSSAKNFAPDYTTTFSISNPEPNGVVTTGTHDWADYRVSSTITFNKQEAAGLVARATGHRRYYAAILTRGQARIIRRCDGAEDVLACRDFSYATDDIYTLEFSVASELLKLSIDGVHTLEASDDSYRDGGAGFVVDTGAVLANGFQVSRIG